MQLAPERDAIPTVIPTVIPTLDTKAVGWSASTKKDQGTTAYATPTTDSTPIALFPAQNEFSDRYTFRVWEEHQNDSGDIWYRVQLPLRSPTEGWIPASQVVVTSHQKRFVIDTSAHTATLHEREEVLGTWRVGIGKTSTPTPLGNFYLWTKWEKNVNSVYGRGVLGLSTHSEALPGWPGGGRIGIHGTFRTSDLARNISHGCIRMLNKELDALWNLLPLGMPIDIV